MNPEEERISQKISFYINLFNNFCKSFNSRQANILIWKENFVSFHENYFLSNTPSKLINSYDLKTANFISRTDEIRS